MLDGATNIFDDCVDLVLRSLTRERANTQEEGRWLPVDRPEVGQISLFQSSSKTEMGVFYGHYEVSPDVLESAYWQIEVSYGTEIADSLLLPFKPGSREVQDSWLSSDTIRHYFATLRNTQVATIDPGYYRTQGFIDSLSSQQRHRLVNKLYQAKLLFWPICEGQHWYLMVIERYEGNAFSINVLDGYNNKQKHVEIARHGKALLSKLYGDHFRVINDNDPSFLIPKQDNAIDCGTAIAYYAYKKTQGESLRSYGEFQSHFCQYLHFRMHMALEVARAALAEVVIIRTPSPVVPLLSHSRKLMTQAAASTIPDVVESQKRRKAPIRVF